MYTNVGFYEAVLDFDVWKNAQQVTVQNLRFPRNGEEGECVYSLMGTNGLPFKRTVTDVRRNERSPITFVYRRGSILGKDSRGRGTAETARSVRNIVQAYSGNVYTRVHWGRGADATVRRDLRSSRTCASSPCYVLAPGTATTIAHPRMSGSHRPL